MVWRFVPRLRSFLFTEKLVIRKRVPGVLIKGTNIVVKAHVVSSLKSPQHIVTSVWPSLLKISIMAEAVDKGAMSLKPPKSVRGMKTLDKDAFKVNALVPSFRVPTSQINNAMMKQLRKRMLKIQGVKPIGELEQHDAQRTTHKLVLLDPESVHSADDLTPDAKEQLKNCGVDMESFQAFEVSLTYDNWRYGEILTAVLPEGCEGVGGFSQIGHIVHLNLREELLEYKNIIGQVLLDKVPSARTVVNKVGSIDTVYRFFAMEVLAGDDDMVATTTEWGVTYKFDFSKVYWNPRLSAEHKRVVDDLQRGDIVYDVFAGVGPFAVPASKKGITVLANDLNPESYKWLNENAKQKIKAPLHTYNMDGRDFIRDVVKKDLLQRWQGTHPDQKENKNPELNGISFFMNLPDLAIEFLDVFPGLFSDVDSEGLKHLKLPSVYCYCFSKSDNPEQDVKERAEAVLGYPLSTGHKIRIVRNVAPNKEMLCIIFTLEKHILFQTLDQIFEPPEKKVKVSAQ